MERQNSPFMNLHNVYFVLSLKKLCITIVSLPMLGLFLCFLSAYIMHGEKINSTFCNVYNIIPSISAITGVSPQRYFWRVCIAFHATPRLLLASLYNSYYKKVISDAPVNRKKLCHRLVTATYYLNLMEILGVVGVSYVSNKENYPIHEKIFIIFMTASLFYMLCTLILMYAGHQTMEHDVLKSFYYKLLLFVISLTFTGGLMFFFWKHRFHCEEMAFSWFSFCEYWIAVANMTFHVTVIMDFPDHQIVVGSPPCVQPQSTSRRECLNSKRVSNCNNYKID